MIFFSVGIQYVTVENVGDFLVIRVSDTTTALESRLRTQHDSTLKRYSCDELHLSLFSYSFRVRSKHAQHLSMNSSTQSSVLNLLLYSRLTFSVRL